MAKQQIIQTRSDNKKAGKNHQPILPEPVKSTIDWASENSMAGQTPEFDNPHFQMAQRQALLLQAGQLYGNQNLQRVIMRREDEDSTNEDKKIKPFTVAGSDERKVLIPRKPNGKTLYFFFGYTGSKSDQKMRDKEVPDLEDDVLNAAARGFLVIYDKGGTKAEFLDALYDPMCYGIYWSGHGYPSGNIQSSLGEVIRPEDVDVKQRSPNINYLILAACNSGVAAKKWQKAVGSQCQFQGWVNVTNTSETIDFTSSAFLDSWSSHEGINSDKELADYINDAQKAK